MEENVKVGTLVQAIGPVIDVRFEENNLPPLLTALEVTTKDGKKLVLEVLQHIGDDTVRTIAMGNADGIQRGLKVINTGSPIKVPVGKEVFETCVWIGRFMEQIRALGCTDVQRIYRKDEKMVICGSPRANDATIRQALIDRFGPVGTKKEPGWFYGVHKDAWAAIAVGVTYHDMQELSNGKRNVGGCA